MGLTNRDLRGPLTQFQTTVADHNREEVWSLILSIKEAGRLRIDDRALQDSFDRYYPELIDGIEGVTKHAVEDVSERNARVFKPNSLFVSTPMASIAGEREYDRWRGLVLTSIDVIKDKFGFEEVVCPMEQISGSAEFEDPEFVAAKDLLQLQQCEYFLMLYPSQLASSVLVELGYAIAQNKKSVVLVQDKMQLPFIIREADNRISNFKIYELKEGIKNPSKFLQKKGRTMFDFERF